MADAEMDVPILSYSTSPRGKGGPKQPGSFPPQRQAGYVKRDAGGKDWDGYVPVLKGETSSPSGPASKPAGGPGKANKKQLPAIGKTAYLAPTVGAPGAAPRKADRTQPQLQRQRSAEQASPPPAAAPSQERVGPEPSLGEMSGRRRSEPGQASLPVEAWPADPSVLGRPGDVASILQSSTRIVMFPGANTNEAYAQIKAPSGTVTVPLSLSEEPRTLKEAYEQRLFLPALPEQWQRRATNLGDNGKRAAEAARELATAKNRADMELQLRDAEIARLLQQVKMQKELMARQQEQHSLVARELQHLKENRKKELGDAIRKNTDADKKVASLQRRLGEMAAEQDRALTEASGALEAIKRERHVLASALAAVAMAAVGGEDVDAAILAAEADAALQEGSDPIPRMPVSWLKFSYVDGPALPPHQAKPGNVTALYGKGNRAQPLGGDGARAVAAMVSHVGRLHRQREEARQGEMEAMMQVRELTDVLGKVDVEYQLVREAVEVMERALSDISSRRQYKGLGLEITGQGNLAARIKTLTSVVGRMSLELEVADEERSRLNAQILELGFYAKLHGRLISEAKEKVKQGQFVKPAQVRRQLEEEEEAAAAAAAAAAPPDPELSGEPSHAHVAPPPPARAPPSTAPGYPSAEDYILRDSVAYGSVDLSGPHYAAVTVPMAIPAYQAIPEASASFKSDKSKGQGGAPQTLASQQSLQSQASLGGGPSQGQWGSGYRQPDEASAARAELQDQDAARGEGMTEDEAAARIQALYRGKQARKEVGTRRGAAQQGQPPRPAGKDASASASQHVHPLPEEEEYAPLPPLPPPSEPRDTASLSDEQSLARLQGLSERPPIHISDHHSAVEEVLSKTLSTKSMAARASIQASSQPSERSVGAPEASASHIEPPETPREAGGVREEDSGAIAVPAPVELPSPSSTNVIDALLNSAKDAALWPTAPNTARTALDTDNSIVISGPSAEASEAEAAPPAQEASGLLVEPVRVPSQPSRQALPPHINQSTGDVGADPSTSSLSTSVREGVERAISQLMHGVEEPSTALSTARQSARESSALATQAPFKTVT